MTCSRHMSTFAASATPTRGNRQLRDGHELRRCRGRPRAQRSPHVNLLRTPGSAKSGARGLARRRASLSDVRARRAVRHDARRPRRIHPAANFRAGALDDPEPGSRKGDGVDCSSTPTCAANGYRATPAACGGGSWSLPLGRRRRCSRCFTNPRRRATSLRRSSGACKGWGKRFAFSATRTPGGRCPMCGFVRCSTATGSSTWRRFADRLPSGTKPNASSSMLPLIRTWTGPCS